MLKDYDFTQLPDTYDHQSIKELGQTFDQLQRELQAANIPVLILLDGWESSGKGYVLKALTREMDPRYVRVEVYEKETKQEKKHPSAWRYWQKIPSKQEIAIYDRSFYYQVFNHEEPGPESLQQKTQELLAFEQALIDDGTIVLKFFLNISHQTQLERIKALETSSQADFLLSKEDYKQAKHHDQYLKWFDQVLQATDLDHSPWCIINAEDKKLAAKEILGQTITTIRLEMKRVLKDRKESQAPNRNYQSRALEVPQEDLERKLSEEEYQRQKEDLQKRAVELVYQCYCRDIPIVLVFEGVDAAGKGGAIKRLTREIDPRSYKIYGIKAPTEEELAHHYLWRFKTKFPQDGLMSIFDRSWYGRVLVERIEGFANEKEWDRAYQEINQMEQILVDHGTIVLKYFLYIDKEEEGERFKARQDEAAKNYKITEEDWRNREKWDAYMVAMEEMLTRTNQDQAPWHFIASNDKYFARIQVLTQFVDTLEQHLKEK
ncbi:hypothetical protein [Ignavigranum ruoffiae]|uniref:hypothetical protein n=1 Tax=Ignavigranum ruoffiae TaxID=89093 RepID=UPI0024AE5D63|nr:hypothetical protein [Ignavigranum ruoffiae]